MIEQDQTVRRVGDLEKKEFQDRLTGAGLRVQLGPFNAVIRARCAELEEPLYHLYRDYPLLPDNGVNSFHVLLEEVRTVAPWRRNTVRFSVDGRAPHEDMPIDQALPVLEWGVNLVIALRCHCFLMLHSAVLERGGSGLLMPAAPGDGKTTLCTGLAHRGWRLLSDEFGLVRPDTEDMIPIPRPMALKNESIEVIRSFAPDAHIGPATSNTRKGTVAHVRPTPDSVFRQAVAVPVSMIVFPRWVKDAATSLQEVSQGEGFMSLATNAFNYELLGEAGFRTVSSLVRDARCFRLVYSDLEDATAMLSEAVDACD